eukprot:TRINITY_DN17196_c0_g1_i8.p1 TRINITY_DN17196_c0_g1~~TRINITY_DN17196_c0_g1_i8.p1  ORF type:complete len:655 (+),score=158.46 TRINITY_DN17196_c0_g1_i8:192-2156(+)
MARVSISRVVPVGSNSFNSEHRDSLRLKRTSVIVHRPSCCDVDFASEAMAILPHGDLAPSRSGHLKGSVSQGASTLGGRIRESFRESRGACESSEFKPKDIFEQALAQTEKEQDSKHVRFLNYFMGVVIILNALTMGLELELCPQDAVTIKDRAVWWALESLFIFIFSAEIVVRFVLEKMQWFNVWWNWLDVAIVMTAVLEQWVLPLVLSGIKADADLSMLTIVRIARLVRLLRVVRLLRMFRGLYLMASAFQQALASMGWVCCIMATGIYICAIFTTTVIGQSEDLKEVRIGQLGDTVVERFGTIPRSIYSLFELMTLEGWHEVGRPLVMKRPALILFLCGYIMVFTFGLLNMVVAVVVDKTLQANSQLAAIDLGEYKKQLLTGLLQVRDYFNQETPDGDIHVDDLEDGIRECEAIQDLLLNTGMPVDKPAEVFAVLDRHGKGSIDAADICEGFVHFKECHHPLYWRIAHSEALCSSAVRDFDAAAAALPSKESVLRLSRLSASALHLQERLDEVVHTQEEQQRQFARQKTSLKLLTEALKRLADGEEPLDLPPVRGSPSANGKESEHHPPSTAEHAACENEVPSLRACFLSSKWNPCAATPAPLPTVKALLTTSQSEPRRRRRRRRRRLTSNVILLASPSMSLRLVCRKPIS